MLLSLAMAEDGEDIYVKHSYVQAQFETKLAAQH